MSAAPVAGWYADPQERGGLRYWDGGQWTHHRSPSPAGALEPAARSTPATAAPEERAVACGQCGRELDAAVAFCSGCGAAAGAARVRKGYKGPRRLVLAGVLAFMLGSTLSFASFAAMHAQGAPALVMSLGGPFLEWGLDALGITQVQAPDTDGVSLWLVLGLVAGALLSAAGVFLTGVGTLWSVARFRPVHRTRSTVTRGRPAAQRLGMQGRARAARTAEGGRARIRTLRARGDSGPVDGTAVEYDAHGRPLPAVPPRPELTASDPAPAFRPAD